MIELTNVSKYYPTRAGQVRVLDGVHFTIRPGEHVGILGRNGAGKSTLIRLISGAERPSGGAIARGMSVSWPLAFGGAFQVTLTGLDNLRFICRVYNVDPDDKVEAVENFSELGIYFREPVRTYSAGMRARLAFAISMAVDFDCFLIDEVIAVGDDRFQKKCYYELFEKRANRARIIVSHDPNIIRQSCTKAAVLDHGKLTHFEDVDSAYAFYAERLA